MEIYNEQMERIGEPDLALGWMENTVRTVYHAAIDAVEEIWHYETAAEYPNGGKDVRRVIDIPGVQAREAWEEEIPVQIYHPYTKEELEKMKQEAEKPTMEERIGRMEAVIETLTGRMDAAIKSISVALDKERGETDGENHGITEQS